VRAPPKTFVVHSDCWINQLYYYDPTQLWWFEQITRESVHRSIVLEIEQVLAGDNDLNYIGHQNSNIIFEHGQWRHFTTRQKQPHSVAVRVEKNDKEHNLTLRSSPMR